MVCCLDCIHSHPTLLHLSRSSSSSPSSPSSSFYSIGRLLDQSIQFFPHIVTHIASIWYTPPREDRHLSLRAYMHQGLLLISLSHVHSVRISKAQNLAIYFSTCLTAWNHRRSHLSQNFQALLQSVLDSKLVDRAQFAHAQRSQWCRLH